MNIPIQKNTNPKIKPNAKNLGFGKFFTDHMFVANYSTTKGWYDARVIPYQPFQLDPAAAVFHYSQELFEGLKAYRTGDGTIQLFRPRFNCARLNVGSARLCMPDVPEELMLEGMKAVLRADADWIPSAAGTAMYVRPTLIASEPFLGVRPADEYIFYIILSPVGSYYGDSQEGVKIWVESEQVRAASGGLGAVKAGANYAASLQAAWKAKKQGFSQVLWLDAKEHRWIEEVGTMNVFFSFGSHVITPLLDGTILPGNIRDSVLHLLHSWNVKVEERRLSIDEVVEGLEQGKIQEMWGTGTAAVISPISELNVRGKATKMPTAWGPLSKKLYDTIVGIQYGTAADTFGWMEKV